MEAEHREILRHGLLRGAARASFMEHSAALPDVGDDADFTMVRDLPREVG